MKNLFYSIAIALLFLWPSAVLGQSLCGPHDEVFANLYENAKESPVFQGLVSDGNMVEIVASFDGSWSLVYTRPSDNMTCIVAIGNSWEILELKKEEGVEN